MKYLQKIPAVIKPPPPEKIIGNLSWVQNDEHLIEYIKVRTILEALSVHLVANVQTAPMTCKSL